MSLRVRLVLALLALFGVGMAVYGVASYRAFASSELGRLDDQVRGTLEVAERELLVGTGQRGGEPAGAPRVVIAPGTYAELRAPDGELVTDPIQYEESPAIPDLSRVGDPAEDALWTVPSVDGDVTWRVAGSRFPSGHTILVAVPMTAVQLALDRLVAIQLVAGAALLVALGVGAWAVLRSGLRPLERIAQTTRSITAGSLEQRVPTPTTDTEVKELATALNGMLDDLEVAFHEREATEARLRRFLSDASHELRTPLTSIQGYAELFRLGADRDGTGDPEDLTLIMRRIEDESDRMRQLVENLLVLARLDETATEQTSEPVDLAVLAADSCSDAVAVDPQRPIDLDAPEPVPVRGDVGHLRQAVGNLVTNALRHTPAGTPVSVRAHVLDGQAVVRVRDRGPGLDEEAMHRAFERFWQADPSRVGAGTGLGLSIVQAVAAEHGGAASADNASDGGAVFTLTLPLDPHPPTGERTDHDTWQPHAS